MQGPVSLTRLNQLSRDRFIETLGSIYEHSPWVADLVYESLPFDSLEELAQCMFEAVRQSPESQRLQLIRNHPELAGKEASTGSLTTESRREQSGAGLDQCSPDELVQLRALNQRYREKFNFPFVIAVTGLNRAAIIAALEKRLNNSVQVELASSISEIGKIASIRLNALIKT